MGVVVPFPVARRPRRIRRAGRWTLIALLGMTMGTGGMVLAGRDLLRSASPPTTDEGGSFTRTGDEAGASATPRPGR